MTAIIRRTPTRALAVVEPFYQTRSLVDAIDLLGRKIWNAWRPARFILEIRLPKAEEAPTKHIEIKVL